MLDARDRLHEPDLQPGPQQDGHGNTWCIVLRHAWFNLLLFEKNGEILYWK